MPKHTFSVDVPTNPDELITLANKILAKDTALGANSPFKPDARNGVRFFLYQPRNSQTGAPEARHICRIQNRNVFKLRRSDMVAVCKDYAAPTGLENFAAGFYKDSHLNYLASFNKTKDSLMVLRKLGLDTASRN